VQAAVSWIKTVVKLLMNSSVLHVGNKIFYHNYIRNWLRKGSGIITVKKLVVVASLDSGLFDPSMKTGNSVKITLDCCKTSIFLDSA
jgi:hypothetical protein